LKEQTIDIPEQVCITRDNVQVGVDGVIFVQVFDPQMASYGISNYLSSIIQLSQTTMRSEVGKIDLDKTFEERTLINSAIVNAINEASRTWGVKILRYEIKNIVPPKTVLIAMEKQMQAEREKRAIILQSEEKNNLRSMLPRDRNKKLFLNPKRSDRNKLTKQAVRLKQSVRSQMQQQTV